MGTAVESNCVKVKLHEMLQPKKNNQPLYLCVPNAEPTPKQVKEYCTECGKYQSSISVTLIETMLLMSS